MALAKKIPKFRIVTDGSSTTTTNHDLSNQNMDIDWVAEYFNDNATDKAVSGFLRQNLRGVRANITLTYDSNIEPSAWRDLVNNLVIHFATDQESSVAFYPDNNNLTSSDKIECIVDDLGYIMRYQSQIGSFVPSITLIGVDYDTSISSNLQAP